MQYKFNFFLIMLLLFVMNCAYYNTFFNAKENYRQGIEKQKKSTGDQIGSDVRKHYNDAIEKSWKLIDVYSDSNKYADDALLLIGQSYYNLADYAKSERVLEQFLLKYIDSDLVPDAKLWLAKTFIAVDQEERALDILNTLFEQKVDNDVAAKSFFILGDLYFKNKDYRKAIENLEKCVEITSDEEVKGSAEFLIGEAFFALAEYENSIYHFERLEKLDVPPLQEYQALIQKINALAALKQYAEADQILRIMLRNQRFSEYFSMIETKLANISEIQGDSDYALELYRDVLRKYPKKEGAALSAFYIGQLYEYEYGNMDSAKAYYDQVKKQYSKSEAVEESANRSALLAEYLEIRNGFQKDNRDLAKLLRGDSTLVDSISVDPIPQDSLTLNLTEQDNFNTNFGTNPFEPGLTDSTIADSTRDSLDQVIGKQIKKVAVSRDPEEVEGSLLRNSFALAEFFLLKYVNYDSARYSYNYFVNNFEDSILTPKAYYALSFIYENVFNDSLRRDSVNSLILESYPETIYAKKLRNENFAEAQVGNHNELKSKKLFLKAEDLLFQKKYQEAVSTYKEIADSDSGTIWAQKSRYAVALLYEKYLTDTLKAITSYQLLAKEYPETEFGKVAKNKVKEPPKEIIEEKVPVDSVSNQIIQSDSTEISSKNKIKKPLKEISEEKGKSDPMSGQRVKPDSIQQKTQKNKRISDFESGVSGQDADSKKVQNTAAAVPDDSIQVKPIEKK